MLFSDNPKDIGTKLGPKLVKLISETIVATKLKLLDTEHRARAHSIQTIIDRAGHEIADLYRPVWEQALAEQDIDPVVKEHIDKIMSGRHQWQAIAGIAFGASGTPNAISQVLSNYLAPSVRSIISHNPELVPDPATAAQLAARFIIDRGTAESWAAGQGYHSNIEDALISLNEAYPDLTTTIELYRRGVISDVELVVFMRRSGIPDVIQNHMIQLVKQILSPADLADMVVRGIRTEGEAAPEASKSGVDASDFADLVLLTGEPPGLMQMLEGYRRGFIDRATLEHGIRQSRYRDEWIPLLEQLRYEPMSVADAVNATVQNYLTPAEAAKIADENGLTPGAFQTLYDTAGEPLSRTEMSELVNRGEATAAQFDQAMRESRVKDKYIPYAFALRRKIPPAREIETAFSHGAINQAEAIAKIMNYGYDAQDAEIIVKSASGQKLTAHKANITSAVTAAYEDFILPRDEALRLIEDMGYTPSEAEFVIEGATFRQSARIVTHAVDTVRSRYTQHHMTRGEASGDLDALGIPAAQRDYLLKMWDLELSTHSRTLTEAQVVKAVKLQLISQDDGIKRLTDMGYNSDDASLLIQGA